MTFVLINYIFIIVFCVAQKDAALCDLEKAYKLSKTIQDSIDLMSRDASQLFASQEVSCSSTCGSHFPLACQLCCVVPNTLKIIFAAGEQFAQC